MLREENYDLLNDCQIEELSGAGDKNSTKIIHIPTKIVTVCGKHQSQFLNKRTCLIELQKKLEELDD